MTNGTPILEITADDIRVQHVVGATPSSGPFPFTFQIFTPTDLTVYNGSTPLTYNETPQNATEYSVAGAGTTTGGTVQLGGEVSNTTITIESAIPLDRDGGYGEGGPLSKGALNRDIQRVLTQVKQLRDAMNRSPKLSAWDAFAIDESQPGQPHKARDYVYPLLVTPGIFGLDANQALSMYPVPEGAGQVPLPGFPQDENKMLVARATAPGGYNLENIANQVPGIQNVKLIDSQVYQALPEDDGNLIVLRANSAVAQVIVPVAPREGYTFWITASNVNNAAQLNLGAHTLFPEHRPNGISGTVNLLQRQVYGLSYSSAAGGWTQLSGDRIAVSRLYDNGSILQAVRGATGSINGEKFLVGSDMGRNWTMGPGSTAHLPQNGDASLYVNSRILISTEVVTGIIKTQGTDKIYWSGAPSGVSTLNLQPRECVTLRWRGSGVYILDAHDAPSLSAGNTGAVWEWIISPDSPYVPSANVAEIDFTGLDDPRYEKIVVHMTPLAAKVSPVSNPGSVREMACRFRVAGAWQTTNYLGVNWGGNDSAGGFFSGGPGGTQNRIYGLSIGSLSSENIMSCGLEAVLTGFGTVAGQSDGLLPGVRVQASPGGAYTAASGGKFSYDGSAYMSGCYRRTASGAHQDVADAIRFLCFNGTWTANSSLWTMRGLRRAVQP